jgi:hypothetical protein
MYFIIVSSTRAASAETRQQSETFPLSHKLNFLTACDKMFMEVILRGSLILLILFCDKTFFALQIK